MVVVSDNFASRIKDPTKKKICYITVNWSELIFTNEDLTSFSVDEYFCTDDDLSFGQVPSARLSFEVVADGLPEDIDFTTLEYPFEAAIGTEMYSSSFSVPSGAISYLPTDPNIPTHVFVGKEDGLYFDGTKIYNGAFNTLIRPGDTRTIIAIGGETKLIIKYTPDYQIDSITDDSASYKDNKFLQRKFSKGACWYRNYQYETDLISSYDVGTGKRTAYETVHLGGFDCNDNNVSRSYIGNVLTFSDLPSVMERNDNSRYWYDEGLGEEFLRTPQKLAEEISQITTPMTLRQLMFEVENYVPFQFYLGDENSRLIYERAGIVTLPMNPNPFAGLTFSFREYLSWLSEALGANVLAYRDSYYLRMAWLNNATEYLSASDIAIDNIRIAYKIARNVDRVLVEDADSSTQYFRDRKTVPNPNTYIISDNPIVSGIRQAGSGITPAVYFSNRMKEIPSYRPCTLTIPSANPAVDVGDTIDAYDALVGEVTVFAYDDNGTIKVFAYEDEEENVTVYAKRKSNDFVFPLMHRKLTFTGASFTAEYEATGNSYRTN